MLPRLKLSNREIEKLRSIFQPPAPTKQIYPLLVPILTALLSFTAGYVLAGKQGDEARRTAKIDRRITAIREASEFVYRKGPLLEDRIYSAWEDVDSMLSEVNSNPQWPFKISGGSTPAELTEVERRVQTVTDSARKINDEAEQLLADGAVDEAIMISLFEGTRSFHVVSDVPAELKMTLQEKAKMSNPFLPKLLEIPSLSRGARVGKTYHLTPEEIKALKAVQSNSQVTDKAILQLSKNILEDRDQRLRNQLASLNSRAKFAIEHLDK